MKASPRALTAALLPALLLTAGGCIVPLRFVPWYVQDPDRDDYVAVSSVGGGGFTLADGRRFELAGVSREHLDGDTALRHDERLGQLLTDRSVLILHERNGRARVVTGGGPEVAWPPPKPPGWGQFPVIGLITIPIITRPPRTDIGEEMIHEGLGTVATDEPGGLGPQLAYDAAQRWARAHHAGVWSYRGYGEKWMTQSLGAAMLDGDFDRARYLLTRAPDTPAQQDINHCLGWMVDQGEVDAVRLMIEFGADVNFRRDNLGNTPLIQAARWGFADTPVDGHPRIARILIAAGADVNHANDEGATALHFAADAGNAELATILLDAGADPALRSGPKSLRPNATPYGWARDHIGRVPEQPRYAELLEMLRARGIRE